MGLHFAHAVDAAAAAASSAAANPGWTLEKPSCSLVVCIALASEEVGIEMKVPRSRCCAHHVLALCCGQDVLPGHMPLIPAFWLQG